MSLRFSYICLLALGALVLGSSVSSADLAPRPGLFRPKRPQPQINLPPNAKSQKGALTIVRVKGASRLLIPRRLVAETSAKSLIRSGAGKSASSTPVFRTIIAGLFLSAGLVCLVLVKRHRKVVVSALVIGAVGFGGMVWTESANGDIPLNDFPIRTPPPVIAQVLGNQVSIELTDGFSVMLLLGDDYQVTGKEGVIRQTLPSPKGIPRLKVIPEAAPVGAVPGFGDTKRPAGRRQR
jgi:hypothetical protein